MQYELIQKLYKIVIADLESQASREYKRGQRKKAARLRKQAQEYYLCANFMTAPSALPEVRISL